LQKETDLEIWDRQAAALGTQMSAYRSDYVKKLAEKAGAVYSEITGGREELGIKYSSNVFGKEVPGLKSLKDEKYIKEYYKKLLASRADDIRSGHTRYGANRDEIVIKTEGRKTREFGSQGQKKSTALALKLASARIYSEKSREAPVILLDDVMGELDENRQRYVYNMIRDMQIFITTCQTASLEKSIYSDPGVKIFKVEKGRIIS
jgi:DNA replication and repair protein RecF